MAARPSKRRKKSIRDRITVAEKVTHSSEDPAEVVQQRQRQKQHSATPDATTAAADTGRGANWAMLREELGVVVVRGRCACAPVKSLAALQSRVSTPVLGLLMGLYDAPTPVQAQTWPLGLSGTDVIAVAQTGSGKTCAYLLPAVEHVLRAPTLPAKRAPAPAAAAPVSALPPIPGAPAGSWKCSDCNNVNYPLRETCNTRSCKAVRPVSAPALQPAAAASTPAEPRQHDAGPHSLIAQPQALVLAPTRELAQQISAEAERLTAGLGVRISCIYGGVGKGAQAAQLRAGGGVQLLIATPGRCLDFVGHSKLIGTPLCLAHVTFLVLDEADRMLEAGLHKEISKIAARCAPRPGRHTAELAQFVRRARERDPQAGVGRIMAQLRESVQGGTHAWAARASSSDVFRALDALPCPPADAHPPATPCGKNHQHQHQHQEEEEEEAPAVRPRQTLFLSATWPAAVQEAARWLVSDDVVELRFEAARAASAAAAGERPATVSKSGKRARSQGAGSDGAAAGSAGRVTQTVHVLAEHKQKLSALTKALAAHGAVGGQLLFAKTRARCDWLVKKLSPLCGTHPRPSIEGAHRTDAPQLSACRWVRALHSGLSQPEREQTLSGYRAAVAAGAGALLVATDVAARGLDVAAMARVLVYDFGGVTSYTHQIGRTGRAGLGGAAECYYVDGDGEAGALVQCLRAAGQPVPPKLLAIAAAEQ